VHFHLQNVVRKLDASNRTHAVAIACSRGLINLR
jgi:DNA-binding CsgD family transcriptional regulator